MVTDMRGNIGMANHVDLANIGGLQVLIMKENLGMARRMGKVDGKNEMSKHK